jgi:hypothetical protein
MTSIPPLCLGRCAIKPTKKKKKQMPIEQVANMKIGSKKLVSTCEKGKGDVKRVIIKGVLCDYL